MPVHSDAPRDEAEVRQRLIGLGERSIRKSYYPELREQIEELERFRGLMQRISNAIFVHDVRNGRFLDVNLAACDMAGLSEAALLDSTFGEIFGESVESGLRGRFESDRDEQVEFCSELGLRNTDISLKIQTIGGKRLAVTVVRDVTERRRAEKTILASLREKEILLKEIHHRVKNNLQIISSLLSLQAHYIKDPAALEQFTESQNRIISMALVHEELYRSDDLSHIPIRHYVRSLCDQLLLAMAPDRGVRLHCDVAEIALDINKAIPCGLIINELLTNALKHGLRGDEGGTIAVELTREEETLRLLIADDGPGFPEGKDFRATGSLGMQLVVSLTDQLRGRVRLESGPGCRFTVTFPTGD